ncbi:MAG: M48 family metallopeptidase [Elusimicrobium sp.]|jgi:predicted metal-dependent hydrolase|nr:M48 family metallopeptidase [Elusimicrobium sp.]
MSEIETTLSDIKLFIESLKTEMPEVFAKDAPARDISGKVLYMGELYDAVVNAEPEAEPSVRLEDGRILITVKDENADAGQMAEDWLRGRAETILKERTAAWAKKMGVEFNSIFIKDQRTMWGSCSDKKNINYSYRIIKMPSVIMDYLIVHELAHLVHMNHADEYWTLVSAHCPDYDKHRKWLSSNRAHIMADTKIKYSKPPAETVNEQN